LFTKQLLYQLSYVGKVATWPGSVVLRAGLSPCRAGAVAAALLVAVPEAAMASVNNTATIVATKAPEAPPPDLASPVWQQAVTATDFVNFTELRPASLSTTAYLLYDGRNLYVAFSCMQRGTPVVATQTVDNVGVSSDDHVTFWIDTSGNGTRVYSFSASPRGVRSETSSENARYAPSWRARAEIAGGDYTVFMTIPLADLRSGVGRSQHWRINFERYVAALNQDDTWAFQPAQTSISSPQFWPTLTNVTLARSATRPKPYADVYALDSAGSQRNDFQNGIGQFQPMNVRNAGVDATVPFTSTLAFVGTLNPDFSNVEEDQTAIAPQEFQRVFTEYRPFFAEGSQYINSLPQPSLFGTANALFYTPSIGVFDRGLKIEGTAGQNAIGLLNVVGPGVDDNAFGYAYTTPNNAFSASSEGVVADHDGLIDDTYGIGLSQTNPHSGQFTQLQAQSEDGTLVTDSGTAQSLIFSEGLRNQHFVVDGLAADIGPQFAPIDGYTAVNDERGTGASVEYLGVGSRASPIQSYSVTVFADRYFDRDGNVRQADINGFYNVTFKNLISISGFAGPSELRSYDEGYPYYTDGVTDWYNRRQISLGYRNNTASPIDFSYTWGPFNGFWTQNPAASISRAFGAYAMTVQYDGYIERATATAPPFNSQWLRSIALSRSFGRDATFSVAFRSVNGSGGLAQTGSNLAMLYQQRYSGGNMLYLEYGTPAAAATLHRFIAKYVFHVGGGVGT
jgi:hypothetical protein